MKIIPLGPCLMAAFLSVLCAAQASDKPSTNFMLKFFSFGGSSQKPSDAIRLDPITVFPSAPSVLVARDGDRLERELNRHLQRDPVMAHRNALIFIASDESVLREILDDAGYAPQNDIAVKLLGGTKLTSTSTLYFHGGLLWRVRDDASFGIRSFGHGAKGFAYVAQW